MSHTGTKLALGDRLVHFITLRNNSLGSGTTESAAGLSYLGCAKFNQSSAF